MVDVLVGIVQTPEERKDRVINRWPYKGLSRVKLKFHARFLGERQLETAVAYPVID